MAAKSIKGNNNLAKRIRTRRNELNLTIEEANKVLYETSKKINQQIVRVF